jgi:AbrB family looped-hinge helix DNA binding protein
MEGSTMTTVTTSAKGQVVIPKKERETVGIKPGSRVMVEAVEDHIEIHPVPENPVEHYCGIFKEGPSLTEALVRDRKEELRHEKEKGA